MLMLSQNGGEKRRVSAIQSEMTITVMRIGVWSLINATCSAMAAKGFRLPRRSSNVRMLNTFRLCAIFCVKIQRKLRPNPG